MPELAIYIIVFIFGAVVGSFLNVCIYRMPLNESVVWPGSHCPNCKKRIAAYDNIPFISYILLKGRCRLCNQKISPVYFFVELLTAFLFVFLFKFFGLSFEFFFYTLFCCLLIVATFVDIKHRIIPDEISVGGLIIGFILSAVRGISLQPSLQYNYHFPLDSLIGIFVGGGVIYLTGSIFDLIYFRLLKKPPIQGETESIGGGDVKLLAMIGSFLGWKSALLTFLLAPFLGLGFGLINLLPKKDHTIPYGPFLSLGALLALFYSDKIIAMLILR